MNIEHSLDISHTSTLAYRQICQVKILVSKYYNVITEVAPGDFQVLVREGHYEDSIAPIFFSFDELRSPMCYNICDRMLSILRPLMPPTTRRLLRERIVGFGMSLVSDLDDVNFGFVVDAKLDVEHFRVASEEELAVFRQFDNMDEDDVEDDGVVVNLEFKGVEKGRYNAGGNKEEVITCSVCLEDLTSGVEFNKLPCSHIFHTSCINPWLERNTSCPNCRTKLEDEDMSLVDTIARILRVLDDRRV